MSPKNEGQMALQLTLWPRLSLTMERRPKQRKPGYKYDVFLSSPMASLADVSAYKKERTAMLEVAQTIKAQCGLPRVYYAGEKIDSPEVFDPASVSLHEDLRGIEASEYFVLILQGRFFSSVIFEAGYALALNKKCVYFVTDVNNLPFLMRKADAEFENVKTIEFRNMEELRRLLSTKKILPWNSSE